LTDFLFQQGFQKSGALLAENLEIEKLINSKLYLQIIELEESLIAKDTQKSLNWCNQNKTKLQKIKSRFEVSHSYLLLRSLKLILRSGIYEYKILSN